MSTIKSEDFDGVTAPALPAGWVSNLGIYATETAVAVSSPNGVKNTAVADSSILYWNTDDGNGGDARASATFKSPTPGGPSDFASGIVFCRMTTPSTSSTTVISYAAEMDFGQGTLYLDRLNPGHTVTLGSLSSITYSPTDLYILTCEAVGTTISARLQRVSDGFWLNSSGSFVSGQRNAISVADTGTGSISGAGKAGIICSISTAASFTIYADDFLFETITPAVTRRQTQVSFI